MSEGVIIELFQQAMFHVIILSAPMLLLGLVVGLAVSIFQATTQIQEATLAFVPKILAVLLAFIVFGPWLLATAVDYTQELFLNLNKFIQ
ncbi:MAG: EscS/YscS/HrcS family type secretion system export apparatus protein [Anaerosolibacter sp.]|jgi:flagellar biosynthetic protein FliQ|uniref:flagellar biosynthesis protein FliQ n=1 Tax=Anaerosolibacter sp. TaxID=1872527 RepID=UPI002602A2F4|nr:flagellar biosynthesis protein FliQ [Anaerosolibacter sp.]MDF2545853.1 EscS/YscS/HrcS family type secretion system export apparatus protein [Anaerosolibacter sp.]